MSNKRFCRRLLSVVAVLLLAAAGDEARGRDKVRWQLGFNAIAGMPRGEFRDAIPDTRWGGSGFLTYRFRDTPFRFGGEMGLHGNGHVDVTLVGTRELAGETEEGLLTSGIYFARFLTRVQPVYGRWSPYVEGVFGLQGFDTSVVLKDCVGWCEISKFSSDTAVSLGGGGGIDFRLTGDDEGESGFSFEIGARYLFGGEAEFYLPSDLPALVRNVTPVPQRSRTAMVTISFGVVFDF